jgi:hypothetical protein
MNRLELAGMISLIVTILGGLALVLGLVVIHSR